MAENPMTKNEHDENIANTARQYIEAIQMLRIFKDRHSELEAQYQFEKLERAIDEAATDNTSWTRIMKERPSV